MLDHIQSLLAPHPRAEIRRTSGRVLIELNGEPYEEVKEKLGRVFGLSSFSPVMRARLDLDSIRQTALEAVRAMDPPPRTFKVQVRRPNKSFPYDSPRLNHLVASYILPRCPELRVDVHNPDAVLQVEVRDEEAYVFSQVVRGLGGFPLGTSGKAMLMLSGGIDSPVAGWMAMRRGVLLEAVHFHSFPYTSERAKQKVIDLCGKLAEYAGEIRLHLVHFTDIQTRLRQEANENLLITLMRRAMMRITERLAHRHRALGIVTGENLGQVASQTLPSLHAIGSVTTLPIIRPLITMDKEEIIRVAEQIETYEISILPYEDCCTLFVPKHPSTNPNMQVILQLEERMSWLEDYLKEAVEKTETMIITSSPETNRTSSADPMEELL
jgi:thiamine biosynthesis protein ThiI